MADDVALRQRRLKKHRAGDHSLCKEGNCPELVAQVAAVAPGEFSRALDDLVAGLDLQPGDPRLIQVAMARSLAPMVDKGSTAAVTQVQTILSLVTQDRQPGPGDPPDSIDIIRAKRAARHEELARRAASGEFDRFGEEIDHPPWRRGSWGVPGALPVWDDDEPAG